MRPAAPVPHVCRPKAASSAWGRAVERVLGGPVALLGVLGAITIASTLALGFQDRDRSRYRGRGRGGGLLLGPVQSRAEAMWLASNYNPAQGQWLKDLSGNGHHLRLGSSGRAEILDGALVLPGATGSYAATPDHSDLDITGDIDIRVKCALDNWTYASASQRLVAKWGDTAGNNSYVLSLGAGTEAIAFSYTPDGSTTVTATGSAAITGVNGEEVWLRATRSASTGTVRYYRSSDGSTWTDIGTSATAPGTMFSGSSRLSLGGTPDGTNSSFGRIHRAIVKDGIDGTTVFDADFSTLSDGTPWFEETTGKRVTVYPTRAVVADGALHLPGVSGQAALSPDHPDLGITGDIDIQVKAALDDWTPSSRVALLSKYETTGNQRSYMLAVGSAGAVELSISTDGAAFASGNSGALGLVDGSTKWIRVTREQASGTVNFYTSDDGTTWTLESSATLAAGDAIFDSTTYLVVGARSAGTAENVAGKIHRAIVKDGIDGTTVFDVDFSTWSGGDGMAVPKADSTGKPVLVLSDTTGADTNDPKWLKHSSEAGLPESKGLYLPGISGNYASVPDEAALDITGDITLDCEVALDDWTPASTSALVAKRAATGQEAYQLAIVASTGTLQLGWWSAAVFTVAASTVAVPVVDGQRIWLRASLDAVEGANRRVKFFTSQDGATWTQLGSDVTGTATSIDSTTSLVEVGSLVSGTANVTAGRFFRARIYNGYFDGTTQAGTAVLDIDFADATEPFATFTADSGQTVTINRASTGRKAAVVDRPMFLFGTDDYVECADHTSLDFGAAESLSMAAVLRHHHLSVATEQAVLTKKDGTATANTGYMLVKSGSTPDGMNFIMSDGAVQESTIAVQANRDGHALVTAAVRSVAGDSVHSYVDGTASVAGTDDTTASLASSVPLRLGRYSGSLTAYAHYELVGAGVWREALTAADVSALDVEYGTVS